MKGGDGVSLALVLANAGGLPRVVEAGPASLKLTVEKPAVEKDKKRAPGAKAAAGPAKSAG